jgi:nitrous oxide reductase accessory protein NosL
MRVMRGTLAVIVIALTGCAANSAQGPTPHEATTSDTGSSSGMVCHEETPTGTTISRQVCRSPEQIDREHKDAEDLARSRGQAPPTRMGTTGQ